MRKILSVFLSIVMMLSCLSLGLTASAAGDTTVSADAVSAKAGETVTVTFKVSNCEDAKALMFYNFTYDSNVFEMTGGEWLFTSSAMQDVSTSDKTAVIAFSTNSAVDGDILKMNFKVADNATSGSYKIGYDVVFKAATDAEDKPIDVVTENVVVNIEAKTDTPNEPVLSYSLGDIDNSGTITAADARAILRFSAKLDDLSAEQQKAADVDGNGTVNAADARITLRISAKLEKIEDYIKDSESTTEAPTTAEPTSEEPTTEAPTIVEPTSEEPTTEAPTTEAPTTAEPTTAEPTTAEPTTAEPTTEEPTTEEPTTEEPTTEEPTTVAPSEDEEPSTVYPERPTDIPEDSTNDCVEDDDDYYDHYDLSWYLNSNIDDVYSEIPAELDEYDGYNYFADGITLWVNDDDIVTDVILTDESEYNIYGVTYGMDYDEAVSILEDNGFTIDEDGYGENGYGIYVSIVTDDGETVTCLSAYIIDDDYDDYDLSSYVMLDFETLSSVIDLYTDGDGLYYSDDLSVFVCVEDDIVTSVEIFDACDYNIYGVEYGMDRATALEILEESGYVTMTSDSEGESIYGETISIIYDEYDTVTYISCSYVIDDDYDDDYEDYYYDLSWYLNSNIDDVYSEIPAELDEYDGWNYFADGIELWVNDDDIVTDVFLTGESEYNIYGVTYGMDYDEAVSILEDYGFTIDENGIGEDGYGIHVSIVTDDGETVTCLCAYIIDDYDDYDDYDLSGYILNNIDNLWDFELNDGGDGWYDLDFTVFFYAPYGRVSQVVINDACIYNICGVEFGMDRETALEILADAGFVMEDDTYGTDDWGYSIGLSYDEDSDTVNYITYSYSFYDVYDLTWYNYDVELIEKYFDVVYDESGWWYSNDNTYSFYLNDDIYGWNYTVDIFDECDFNIFGVTYGMDRETALSILADAGFEIEDDTYIIDEVWGYTISLEYDEDSDTVSYIAYCDSGEYEWEDLSSYVMFDFETLSSVIDLYTDGDGLYYSDDLSVFVCVEDDIVTSVEIFDACDYNIYGVEHGMDRETALEILEESGYVTMTSDSEGESIYGETISITYDEYDTVNYISCSYVIDDDYYYDFSWYLNSNIDYVYSEIPAELEYDEEYPGCYFADGITLWVNDNYFVTDVILSGESEYNIYGVTYGMDYDEAVSILEDYEFTIDEDGYGENGYGIHVSIVTDDGETVTCLCAYIIDDYDDYDDYDLSGYVLNNIDNLWDLELNDEGDGWYDLDFTVFFYAPYGRVSQVVINDACIYNICGVEFGMDRETALEILSDAGFVMEDDTYGTDVGYSIGLSYDEDSDTVNYITYIYSFYDVYDLTWYMYDIELIENYFDVVYDESGWWYSNDTTYSFYIDEGYNYIVDIFDECDFNIYGVEYGMDRATALEILEDSGYVTMTSDFDGETISGETISITYDEYDTVTYISCSYDMSDIYDVVEF